MKINLDRIIFVGAISLAVIAVIIFGYIDYRAKHKTNNTESNESQEFQSPGSDIIIYDIDDGTVAPETALITWRTNKKTTEDFVECGLSKETYTFKVFSKNSNSGLYHLIDLIGLEPDTTYHCRIVSADLEGNKTTTPDRTFKTIYRDYNSVSSLDFVTTKEPDKTWLISKDQKKRTFSLGSYKLHMEKNTFLRIPKIWIMFKSDSLSDREDKMYGLENAYLLKMLFRKDSETKEINLGKSGEYMLIELADYPLGNLSPQESESDFEFEIVVELVCNNLQNKECLDNQGKPLDYINNHDI